MNYTEEFTKGGSRDPYTTTYTTNHTGEVSEPVRPIRPRSTVDFQARYEPLDGQPHAGTTYGSEYHDKRYLYKPTEKMMVASDEGTRVNNPHPSDTFMKWNLKQDDVHNRLAKFNPTLVPDIEKAVFKIQLSSTYQDDYFGAQQPNLGGK